MFLAHARDCLVRIADYAAEGEAVFLRDRKTQDAIFRNLEIVGQCIKDAGSANLRTRVSHPNSTGRTIADFANGRWHHTTKHQAGNGLGDHRYRNTSPAQNT
ncbi:MAG: DUF86 domain-containing protein [Propionivibrio sp.]|nr:DUF86 domain-containing protein [Propionivibrio sp.]